MRRQPGTQEPRFEVECHLREYLRNDERGKQDYVNHIVLGSSRSEELE